MGRLLSLPNILRLGLLAAIAEASLAESLAELRLDYEAGRSLGTLLRLEEGGARLLLGTEADEEGLALSLGLRAGGLVLGPGRLLGAFRLLEDPAALGRGLGLGRRTLELDSGLSSSTALLGLESRGFAAFGLLRGAEEGLLLRRAGPKAGAWASEGSAPAAELPSWEAAAGGLLLSLPLGAGLELGLLGSLGLDRGRAGGEGWRPEPPPAPPESAACLGLLLEGRGGAASARLGLAASAARAAGPGLALRLEAEAGAGGLSARAFAGALSAGFRNREAREPPRLGACGLDLGLGLRRGARLGLEAGLEAPRAEGGRLPPLLRGLGLLLALPLPGAQGPILELRARREAGEGGESLLSLELSRGRGSSLRRLSAEAALPEAGGSGGPTLRFGLRAREGSARVEAALGMGLEFPEAGRETPRGDLSLELGGELPAGGRLGLELAWSELELRPRLPGEAWPEPALSLGYRHRLALPRGRWPEPGARAILGP